MVELGEYDVSGNNEIMSTRQAKVKRVVVHKDYVQPTFENDIAILELVFHLFSDLSVNVTNILLVAFSPISFPQKFRTQTESI